jgi:hypothetical protein
MEEAPKLVTGTVDSIVNASKKSGESSRNGKTFNWNIMTVNVKTDDGKTVVADSFEKLQVGEKVSLTFDEQYNTANAKRYKPDYNQEMLRNIYNMVKDIYDIVKGNPRDLPTDDIDEDTMPDGIDIVAEVDDKPFNLE